MRDGHGQELRVETSDRLSDHHETLGIIRRRDARARPRAHDPHRA
jgi:hypothetical protein